MRHVTSGSLLIVTLALAASSAVAQTPGPAPAKQLMGQPDCTTLIAEINTATSNRYDPAAANAKQMAAQAAKLQADGKQADCIKMAQDTLASLGSKK